MQSLLTMWNGAAFPISPAQITARINHTGAYGVSHDWPRFKLLDRTLAPVSTGYTGPLGDAGDISRFVTRATITNDTTQAVHRQLDLELAESPLLSYDPLRHYIQAFWDYFDGSGNLLLEAPLGIFGFVLPEQTIRDSGIVTKATLLDLTHKVARLPFLNTWVVPKGQNYVTAITNMLTTDYLPKSQGGTGVTPSGLDMAGPNIPAGRINITPTTFVTPGTISFGRDVVMINAINQLLASINYYPLWVDSVGTFRSSPRPNLSQSIPAPGWTYTTDESAVIIPGAQWRVINAADLANIVSVYCEPTNGPAFAATAYNNKNTLSSICLTVLGEAIPLMIKDPNIPDQPSCTLRAYVELTYRALAAAQLTFQSTVNPFHEAHEALSVTILDQSGNVVAASPNGWEEVGWTIDASARTASRTVGAYFIL